jgi:hypothetical protein
MHCKHCGNQIANDSKFCSFCGGKIDPIAQNITTNQPVTQVQTETISSPPYEKSTSDKFVNAFLVIALADFGFSLFWIILRIIVTYKEEGYKFYEQIEPITKPLSIIHSSLILFLCFLFTKKKENKTLFLILAICILAWNIYNNYIKT